MGAITIIPADGGRLRSSRRGCCFRVPYRRACKRAGPRETIKRNQVPNMNLSGVFLLALSVTGAAVARRAAACPACFRCVGPGRVRPWRAILPGAAAGRARRLALVENPCVADEIPSARTMKAASVFAGSCPNERASIRQEKPLFVQNGYVVSSFQKCSPDKSVIFDEKTEAPAIASSFAK
jgi:hypothetical protein